MLTDFKLLKEDETSYHLAHPAGRKFIVTKKGLSPRAHEIVKGLQHFDAGGTVAPDFVPGQSYADAPLPGDQNASFVAARTPTPIEASFGAGPGMPGVFTDQAATLPIDVAVPKPNPAAVPAGANFLPQTPVQGDPLVQNKMTTEDLLNRQEKELTDYTKAATGMADQNSKAYSDYSDSLAKLQTPNQIADTYKAKDDALLDAYKNNKIDPDRYLHSLGTGSKILAGIGIVLSGMGSGLTGQKNMAMEQINRSIEADIDAQKNDQSKAANLWKMNREAMGSDIAANLATSNQFLTGVQAKVMKATAGMQGADAKLRGQMMIDQIEEKKNANRMTLGLLEQGQNGGASQADPASLVSTMVPEVHQKQVFEEIKNAQNVGVNGPKITTAFNNAANEFKGVPWQRDQVKALHQLLLPNFKLIDGTVRQAAMDETFHNVTPQFGDSEATLETKRQALKDWMTSESAAPTAKGFGINLNNFKSTAPPANSPKIETMNGVRYQKVPGGWKKVG